MPTQEQQQRHCDAQIRWVVKMAETVAYFYTQQVLRRDADGGRQRDWAELIVGIQEH